MNISSPISQLGKLVKAYRENLNLTQLELLDKIEVKTNRSTIAHLEQGLRLPRPMVLRSICSFLNIPEQLWINFESPNIRKIINAGPELKYPIESPGIISVSGIMGSGKTTLARLIASSLGYKYISENRIALAYLKDLNTDPSRWAFETQLTFLCQKSLEILKELQEGNRLILDRTISEDADVFATYFKNINHIDERAYQTYRSLVEYFKTVLPDPEIVIYCKCSVSEAYKRINERGRLDKNNHSKKHLEDINKLYTKWLGEYDKSTIYTIDSEKWDWRKEKNQQYILREFEYLCSENEIESTQLYLFADKNKKKVKAKSPFKLLRKIDQNSDYSILLSPAGSDTNTFPTAYIAAPFTAIATTNSNNQSTDLFKIDLPHGEIKKGKYRNALLSVESGLQTYGISSIIPHRDVNSWGSKILSAREVVRRCTEQVTSCDLFVAILGDSHGAHYEFGLALGMNKPCVIIHCSEINESFISNGFDHNNKYAFTIYCEKLSQIKNHLLSEEFKKYINKYIEGISYDD